MGGDCRERTAAADRFEAFPSRTARPDTQPIEVPWKVKAKPLPEKTLKSGAKAGTVAQGRAVGAANIGDPGARAESEVEDQTETLKTLLHLAREQGQLTYDDINDLLPDGMSPDVLDGLYKKLHNLGVEVVAQLEG